MAQGKRAGFSVAQEDRGMVPLAGGAVGRITMGLFRQPVGARCDGRLKIDNKPAERIYSTNRMEAVRAPAAIYSLVGTAQWNAIDPESYLRNVLSRIA